LIMPTAVIVNDIKSDTRLYMGFSDKHFASVKAKWNARDRLLVDLAEHDEMFVGYDRWSRLTPKHYHYLLTRIMVILDTLSDYEKNDENNGYVKSFHSVTMAFIHSLEVNSQSKLDLFKIHRYTDVDIFFEYQASISYGATEIAAVEEPLAQISRPEIRIILDNTKGT
jgi:hypothetical protein